MDLRLPPQSPVSFTTALRNGFQSNITPFVGLLSTRSIKWRMDHMIGKKYQITASSGFSKRKKKRSFTPRFKDSTHKGFWSRTQVPTSTKRKDQKNDEGNEGSGSGSSLLKESSKTLELTVESNDEESTSVILRMEACGETDDESAGIALEDSSRHGSLLYEISLEGNGKFAEVDGHTPEVKDVDRIPNNEENITASGAIDVLAFARTTEENQVINGNKTWHENTKNESGEADKITDNIVTPLMKLEHDESAKTVDNADQSFSVEPAAVNGLYSPINMAETKGDVILKPKSDQNESLRSEAVHRLAEGSFKKGNKLFHYPELVKPDQQIELFLNKSFSTLKNENDVMIKGAFNDWKWKPFTLRMNKSNLNGDWWSCKIHVPGEAYKIDFVFQNGKDAYDNNYEQEQS